LVSSLECDIKVEQPGECRCTVCVNGVGDNKRLRIHTKDAVTPAQCEAQTQGGAGRAGHNASVPADET
jgi:hypothetical protein